MEHDMSEIETSTAAKLPSPADVAQSIAEQLSVPTSLPLRPQDVALLDDAEAFRFGPDDSRCAWSIGEGPLVLMVHGWGGRGVQMAPLAHTLAAAGFRCVFFDAAGHGDSRPEPVGFDTFIRDTAALTEHVGEPVYAWVAHSAGGLGLMAARALKGVKADRYVCIAAPRFPYVPIDGVRQRLNPPEDIVDLVKAIVAGQFESDWQTLETGHAFRPDDAELLLAYDMDDPRVRHGDGDLIAECWPGSRLIKTSGFGHNKVLQAPEVLAQTLAFLKEGAPSR
jgi:pimeloyl-ACP methyl ester carboxylesterase